VPIEEEEEVLAERHEITKSLGIIGLGGRTINAFHSSFLGWHVLD
jgi:hypothetical protein